MCGEVKLNERAILLYDQNYGPIKKKTPMVQYNFSFLSENIYHVQSLTFWKLTLTMIWYTHLERLYEGPQESADALPSTEQFHEPHNSEQTEEIDTNNTRTTL